MSALSALFRTTGLGVQVSASFVLVGRLGSGPASWVGQGQVCGFLSVVGNYKHPLLLLISSYDPYASSSFTSVDKPQVNPQNV